MTKTASIYVEFEEHLDDEVDEDTFADYDDVNDIREFTELLWEKRFEDLGFDGRVKNIDCYKIDE